MPRIEWAQSFSVHNDEIDDQHKQWFAIFNKMHETMLDNSIKDYDRVATEALNAMKEYADHHFSSEEKYMQDISFPDLADHQKIHESFAKLINQYQDGLRSGQLILNTEIISVIKRWLLHHILTEDKKYCQFADSRK